MTELNPLVLVGAVIGAVTALLVLAYALVKDKKETMGFERTMADSEILRRLAAYARPYRANASACRRKDKKGDKHHAGHAGKNQLHRQRQRLRSPIG